MEITNSQLSDIEAIFGLYDAGTEYQKTRAPKHWKGFEKSLIETEIRENRHWKIIEDGLIACTFSTTFSDAVIWGERDCDPSLYIHRISTHPGYRGRSYVRHIVNWAKAFAKKNYRKYLRMDTGSGNEKLNNYYISCGFQYKGIVSLGKSDDLPEHYQNNSFSLFELQIESAGKIKTGSPA